MAGRGRRPTHAGSWYDADGATLKASMEGWLEAPPRDAAKTPARAIIAPHAGWVSHPLPALNFRSRHTACPRIVALPALTHGVGKMKERGREKREKGVPPTPNARHFTYIPRTSGWISMFGPTFPRGIPDRRTRARATAGRDAGLEPAA